METIKIFSSQKIIEEEKERVLALGCFDGVHLGHQAIIRKCVELAKASSMEASVLTFDPHPSTILNPSEAVSCLTPLNIKKEIFSQHGIRKLYVLQFDQQISRMQPAEFIENVLQPLKTKKAVIGFDFCFGTKGSGNAGHLESRGIQAIIQPPFELENKKVSSTRIRENLKDGKIREANRNLGKPYEVLGTVIHGDQRGRKLGFPTANISSEFSYVIPKYGVYAVEVVHEGKTYQGIANCGVRPTFEQNQPIPKLEVNIFDFDKYIYGHELKVKFIDYVREEKRFSSVADLISQMKLDVQVAQQMLIC